MNAEPHDPNERLSRISAVAFELNEQIGEHFGDSAQVCNVLIVADVIAPNGKGGYVNPIVYESSEIRRWVQAALLTEAAAQAEMNNEMRREEVEETLEPAIDDDLDDD